MENLIGQRFGRWEVISFVKKVGSHHYWRCKCDCGKENSTRSYLLKNGTSKSCGCLARELSRKRKLKHGFFGTKFYDVFKGVKERCRKVDHHAYKNYGGRGIECLWETFEEFRDDMHESYLEHLELYGGGYNTSIDRINNDGNYCKENCRWATQKEQMNNKRSNYLIKYKNETKTLMEWSKRFKIEYYTLSSRIKRGWEIEKALKTPSLIPRK